MESNEDLDNVILEVGESRALFLLAEMIKDGANTMLSKPLDAVEKTFIRDYSEHILKELLAE